MTARAERLFCATVALVLLPPGLMLVALGVGVPTAGPLLTLAAAWLGGQLYVVPGRRPGRREAGWGRS